MGENSKLIIKIVDSSLKLNCPPLRPKRRGFLCSESLVPLVRTGLHLSSAGHRAERDPRNTCLCGCRSSIQAIRSNHSSNLTNHQKAIKM